jgi:small-conductance mechanosensitive channel
MALLCPARAAAQPQPAHSATAAPEASGDPDPGPTPHATAEPAPQQASAGFPVRLLDRRVFVVRVPRGNLSAEERARTAAQVLERAAAEDDKEPPVVRVEESGDVAAVFVGTSPLIQLGPEDAEAAGDASLSLHAASIAATVRDAIAKERSRSQVATGVFSFSLLVFCGLMAFLLLGKVRELFEKARSWIDAHPDRLPVLRVRGIEVVRPAAFQGALSVALGVARILAQIGIFLGWLFFSLSLFDATSGYAGRLAGFLLTPLSALVGRIASALPALVLVAIAALAVFVLIRFLGLFFGSIARGETSLGGLPKDLAIPTGVVVRFGIILAALVFVAPLVTGGEDEGSLARAGVVVLVALGLASTPILASSAVGLIVVYGRRVRVGDVADIGGRAGRVRQLNLLEVRLEDEDGCDVRVPHLLSLVHPTRVVGRSALVVVDLVVAPEANITRVRELIIRAAGGIGNRAKAALVAYDADGARFRATMFSDLKDARSHWLSAIAEALKEASVPLGRGVGGGSRRAPIADLPTRPGETT